MKLYLLIPLLAAAVASGAEPPIRVAPATVDEAAWMRAWSATPVTRAQWLAETMDQARVAVNPLNSKGIPLMWGPLGFHALEHNRLPLYLRFPQCTQQFPKALQDGFGGLAVSAFEVTKVAPASPADGHLLPGDLILKMDGEAFLDASLWRPERQWMAQEFRGLELQAADLLDAAEARGQVAFTVLRPPSGKPTQGSQWELPDMPAYFETRKEKQFDGRASTEEIVVDCPVQGGDRVRLSVSDRLPKHRGASFQWELALIDDQGRTLPIGEAPGKFGPPPESGQEKEVPLEWRDPARKARYLKTYGPLEAVSTFEAPPGRWRLVGRGVSSALACRAQLSVASHSAWMAKLQPHCRTVSFSIPKLGSFAMGQLPRNDPKVANIVALTAAWLARQQRPNGSWERLLGYTGDHFDTSWAALGLMATGDSRWDPQIQKAAEYIAFGCANDHWAAPNATALAFLAEYWLRYRDDRILPPLQARVYQLFGESNTANHWAGHGISIGYGGGGVSYGGSHLLLALALASKTPVEIPHGRLDSMFRQLQQMAPDGFLPYGRFGGTGRFETPSQGAGTYSARHGPALVACLIAGGPAPFTNNCQAMYASGFGKADQGHSSQTFSLMWALIATGASDETTYLKHFDSLRWKFAITRLFNGGFIANPNGLEYQGGEELFGFHLRAGFALVALCADRHQLAMTGNPRWRAKSLMPLAPTRGRDFMDWNNYRQSWKIAEAALGDKAPAALVKGVEDLADLPMGAGLRSDLIAYVEKAAPVIARAILAETRVEPQLRMAAAELVLGADVKIEVGASSAKSKPLSQQESPQPFQQLATEVRVGVTPPFSGLYELPEDKTSLPRMEGAVTLEDAQGQPLAGSTSFSLSPSSRRYTNPTVVTKLEVGLREAKECPVFAHVRYRIGDMSFDYVRPLTVGWGTGGRQAQSSAVQSGEGVRDSVRRYDREVWVRGKLHGNYFGPDASFVLDDGALIQACTAGQELMLVEIDGRWHIRPDRQAFTLTRGAEGFFGCVRSHNGEINFHRMRLIRNGNPVIPLGAPTLVRGGKLAGDWTALVAGRTAQIPASLVFDSDADDAVLEFPLEGPVAIDALDMQGLNGVRTKIQGRIQGEWKTLWWGRTTEVLCDVVDNQVDGLRLVFSKENVRGARLVFHGLQFLSVSQNLPQK